MKTPTTKLLPVQTAEIHLSQIAVQLNAISMKRLVTPKRVTPADDARFEALCAEYATFRKSQRLVLTQKGWIRK